MNRQVQIIPGNWRQVLWLVHELQLFCSRRVALCIDGPQRFCSDSKYLLGKEAIKQRHLRLLGYQVVQVKAVSMIDWLFQLRTLIQHNCKDFNGANSNPWAEQKSLGTPRWAWGQGHGQGGPPMTAGLLSVHSLIRTPLAHVVRV